MNQAMNEDSRMIFDTVDRMLREHCGKELVDSVEQGQWPAELWTMLQEAGLTLAAAPERLGGSALALGDALAMVRLVGRHAAPVPLAEQLLAGALAGGSALDALPEGPVVVALGEELEVAAAADGLRIDGVLEAVPFARHAAALLLVLVGESRPRLALVPAAALTVEPGSSMAGEPRDRVSFDGVEIPGANLWTDATIGSLDEARALLALTRAVMMAGALEAILEMSVTYALERKQFGRPIAGFQAVQQMLAVLAGEVAAAQRAADGALEALDGAAAPVEIAVAKARVGEAAGRGAEIAHQVHGAMGFTYEHPLHQRTRRLWAWRDEHGNERAWQVRLGREICAAGADELWGFLTHTRP